MLLKHLNFPYGFVRDVMYVINKYDNAFYVLMTHANICLIFMQKIIYYIGEVNITVCSSSVCVEDTCATNARSLLH